MRIDFSEKTISTAIMLIMLGFAIPEYGARQVDEQPGNHA